MRSAIVQWGISRHFPEDTVEVRLVFEPQPESDFLDGNVFRDEFQLRVFDFLFIDIVQGRDPYFFFKETD